MVHLLVMPLTQFMDLFSNGTGLYYNSFTDTPNGEIGISDTGVGAGLIMV